MHDPCDHDHGTPPAGSLGSLGIPRPGAFDGPAFERAVADLLRACGIAADGAHTGRTPRRVRELWERRLLGGYALDPAEVLGTGFADPRQDMVVVRGIAVQSAGSPTLATCPAGGCTASAASRAWSTPSATASLTRNG